MSLSIPKIFWSVLFFSFTCYECLCDRKCSYCLLNHRYGIQTHTYNTCTKAIHTKWHSWLPMFISSKNAYKQKQTINILKTHRINASTVVDVYAQIQLNVCYNPHREKNMYSKFNTLILWLSLHTLFARTHTSTRVNTRSTTLLGTANEVKKRSYYVSVVTISCDSVVILFAR